MAWGCINVLEANADFMRIAGVDEAGRGCVIGPLVIAGVVMDEDKLSDLVRAGVRDSKLLSAGRREVIAREIMRIAERCAVVKLLPAEIDWVVDNKRRLYSLNRLEAQAMAKVIEKLEPDMAFVDAADVVEERFARYIREGLVFKTRIVAEHKADRNYLVVSAASIIAKVERDKEVALLRSVFGDFGSGYLSDPRTVRFLREWVQLHEEYPDCVRKSWKPAKRIKAEQSTAQKRFS